MARTKVRYPGARFGKLTLIEKIRTNDKHKYVYMWRCQCDCGTIKLINETNLRVNGGARSCGCKKLNKTVEIKPGDRFNYFTVVELSDIKKHRDGMAFTQYLCQCKCGRRLLVERVVLIKGYKKSCGCRKKVRKQRGTIDDFMFISEAAERFGVSFNVVNERIKHAKKMDRVHDLITEGLLKHYIPPGSDKGHWLIARQLMDEWFIPKEDD